MGILNGILGAVDGIDTIRGWSVDTSADIQRLIASNTKGGPLRLPGNKDWGGNYNAYGHTPLKMPGSIFTFHGSLDGANGVEGSAIVESVEISIDIEGGLPISHVVNFAAMGVLDLNAVKAVSDAVDVAAFSAIQRKVMIGTVVAVPVWTEVPNVRTVTLGFSAENPSYVSSQTAGHTKRLKGNIDGSLAMTVYEGDPGLLIPANTVKAVRVYVTATLYWELYWMMFREASGIEANREDGSLIGATQNAEFNGFTDVAAVQTEGHIINPAVETWWPAA